MRAAVAVELVHSATLVHDDVLDAAALRRGRPTVVAAGRPRDRHRDRRPAVLARVRRARRAADRSQPVRVLSDASSALAEGELLQREDAWNAGGRARALPAPLRAEDRAAVRGRVRARGAGGRRRRGGLGRFGRRIGLAFQMLDDVLDVSGPAERTGKPRGTDLLDGTVTLPLILARERDPALRRARPARGAHAEQAEGVCDAIAATGALEAAREAALAMVADAKADLPALPERPAGGAGAGGRRRRRALQLT